MHEFSISLVTFSGVVDRFCGEISSTLYVSLFKELCIQLCEETEDLPNVDYFCNLFHNIVVKLPFICRT